MLKHPLANCQECPLEEEPFVASIGPEIADIVIVGEAPGLQEVGKGQPFTGPSGKLLDTVLQHNNIPREKAFLTNVCLCRPKSNDTPSKLAIECCSKRLNSEIVSREPKKILTLGVTATNAIMGTKVKITTFRAGPPKESELYPNVSIIPTIHPAACLRSPDHFPSLCADVEKLAGKVYIKWEPPKWKAINEWDEGIKAVDELLNYDNLVIDIETAYEKDAAYVQPGHYPLLCVGVGFAPGRVVVFGEDCVRHGSFRFAFRHLLHTKGITAHNGKFDLNGLKLIGEGTLDFDTMLAHYCIDERRGTHKLEYLSGEYLGAPSWKHMVKNFKAWKDILRDDLHAYNAIDVHNTWGLRDEFKPKLVGDLAQLNTFLLSASKALQDIEYQGIHINEAALDKLDESVGLEKIALERQLTQWVANPRSPKQVKAALADMSLNVASTDRETLLALQSYLGNNLFVNSMLDYRKVQKLYDTYVKGIRARLFERKVHTSFLLHGSVTGRLSSRNPNLQNIPRDDKRIKSLFTPAPGNTFVQADYNQIELRVVACEARDTYLQSVFDNANRDIFGELACDIFGVNWTKAHRQIVKRVVHGTNYGMGPNTMAAQMNSDAELMGVPERYDHRRAKLYQAKYLKMVPDVVTWQQQIKKELFEEHDDLTTPFGRHRRFWLITRENKIDIEHEGLAFKPQSIASDINLRALVELHKRGIALRLSVHDSLMAECAIADAKDVGKEMEEVMLQSAREYSDYCKFAVEIQTGQSWGALA